MLRICSRGNDVDGCGESSSHKYTPLRSHEQPVSAGQTTGNPVRVNLSVFV